MTSGPDHLPDHIIRNFEWKIIPHRTTGADYLEEVF
jgi:hypothetical protein